MSWWKRLLKRGGSEPETSARGGCDHGEIRLREGTADFEWFVSRSELEMGTDLAHGARHLANLLSYDPANQEWLGLLEEYIVRSQPDPERLIPRQKEAYFSIEALRAYLWHRQGRLADACQLLAQVTHAKPDARYLEAWALPWLEPAGAMESLPESSGWFLFALVLQRFPEARYSPARRLREVQRWARLCERFAQLHPGAGEGRMIRAGILRKAGLFTEAEALIRTELAQAPSWHLATALGLVLRQKGDVDGAEQSFRYGLELDPADVSARLEAGDTFFDRELWQRALDWYESALAMEKRHPWAYPSALFCRRMLTEDEQYLRELTELARKGNERAQQLQNQFYFQALPEPLDASANVLRQIRDNLLQSDQPAEGGKMALTLSCLEAPSNALAFRLEMEALRSGLTLEVTVEAIPRPDPRVPIADVKYRLWRYEGTSAVPGLPPPAADVVECLDRLARPAYDESACWAAASWAAEQLGPARAGEILAGMLYPPPVPDGLTALAWLPRVQHIAAQILAHLGDGGEGWDGSVRREALLSALHGPQDWTTVAAIRALARLGRQNEAIAPQIGDAFQLLAEHRPHPGACCWDYALYESWLSLPHLFPSEREEMQKRLEQIATDSMN